MKKIDKAGFEFNWSLTLINKKNWSLTLIVFMGLFAVMRPASANTEAVKIAVEAWLQGRHKVDEVRKTPISGMYEVRIGTELIYVDDKGEHAFVEGELVNIKVNRNLTRERVEELTRIEFKDLPIDLALKQVMGNGKRKLAVFEDPNCGHCRNLRVELNKLENVTLYTFTYPILAKDSITKVEAVWCAKDKLKAWNELMLTGRVPVNDGKCTNPVAKISEYGRKMKITGTPTLVFANGKRVPGGVPGAELRRLIDANSGT
jgi:thiol:disulfide interchange protein DsbC